MQEGDILRKAPKFIMGLLRDITDITDITGFYYGYYGTFVVFLMILNLRPEI